MRDLDDLPRVVSGPGSAMHPLRTLGVLGDIHAEDRRLETAIAWLKERGVDRIVHVGDVCDGVGDLPRTLALLASNGVLGVSGNHERWFLSRAMRQLKDAQHIESYGPEVEQALRFLPPLLELSTVRGALLLCHAVGDDDMMVLKPDSILGFLVGTPAFDRLMRATRLRFVVAGHTHQPAVHPVGHLTWINAGTLKGDDQPVVTRIDFGSGRVEFASLRDATQVGEVTDHPL